MLGVSDRRPRRVVGTDAFSWTASLGTMDHSFRLKTKMALSIRVTDTTGKKPGFAQVVLRETVGKFLSGLLLGIGYLWLVFDARRQSLHDKLAKTYVMDR